MDVIRWLIFFLIAIFLMIVLIFWLQGRALPIPRF